MFLSLSIFLFYLIVHLVPFTPHQPAKKQHSSYNLPLICVSAEFNADVDVFVVHTDYDEHAMMLQLSTEKPSGIMSTAVKLYSE